MGLIIWDIEEEREKNRKNANKILNKFNDVDNLQEVLDDLQSLMDSEIYKMIYLASKKDPEEMTSYIDTVDDLLKLRQVKLASKILKSPTFYLTSFTGVIVLSHFKATFSFIGGVHYAQTQKKLKINSTTIEHLVLEKLMSLLDDFDKPQNFQPPTEEFYEKLKNIGWDKKGKKLHKKMYDILYHLNDVRFGGSGTFSNGENFTLTFLAACNTVNQNRDNISPEDVVMAYKTFLKLINTDITKLV